jgi:uncharacterized membrane protein
MIIMALDHVRDFFHRDAMLFSPEDLARTYPALFLTRWSTHICAPAFVFTAGLSAYLWMAKGRKPGELSSFLWKRGLWLVLLDLIAVRFAMFFSLTSAPVILTTLWALGWSMVVLGFVHRLPRSLLLWGSLAVIATHNLLDGVPARMFGSGAWVWTVLHQPGAIQLPGVLIIVGYPLIPWVAVMALGFALGPLFQGESSPRSRWLIRAGVAAIVCFVLLRFANVYGDPQPWKAGWISFLRTTKYPPSLQFLFMTLGPGLLLLAVFERIPLPRTNPLVVFGRVPLFYYLGHLLLAHLLAFPLAWWQYGRADFVWNPLPSMGGAAAGYPAGYGLSLGTTYAIWIAVVVALYPLCLWYSRLKERRPGSWLQYL